MRAIGLQEPVSGRGLVLVGGELLTQIDLEACPDLVRQQGELDAEVEGGDATYRKLVRDGSGILVGAVLVGDLTDRGKIAGAIRGGKKSY